jgi:hypothetical protein
MRPLGVGEILDVAIKVFSKNARTLITIGAIVGVPLELLSGVVQLSTVSSADDVSGSFSPNLDTTNSMGADFSRTRVAGLVVVVVIGLLVSLLLTAATVKAVSDAYLGRRPSVRDSLVFAVHRIGALMWLYLLLGIGVALAAIALVIPAIWLYVAWSVATPALLIEDIRGAAALRRSFRLVRRRWWPTFGVQFMAVLLVYVATVVVSGLLAAIPLIVDSSSVLLAVVSSTIASAAAAALVQPLQGAITTILYFDLRVRKEGFDLSLLASRLGLPEPEVPPHSPPGGGQTTRGELGAGGETPPYRPPPPGWKPGATEE